MLASATLTYEPLVPEHAQELVDALGDPRVSEHCPEPEPSTIESMRSLIHRLHDGPPPQRSGERWLNFVVRLGGSPIIGRLEATIIGPDAELAFLFAPTAWGRGYASEAVRWLEGYCRDSANAERFWAAVTPENERAIRLLQRLGYEETRTEEWPQFAGLDPRFRMFRF